MHPRLQAVLAAEYPGVFRDLGGDVRQTCMGWGITCGDGWFLILWRLCEVLEADGAIATQIKEKYGGLRFYIHGGTDASDDAITAAEAESEKTCEVCGRPGRQSSGSWIVTRCEEC